MRGNHAIEHGSLDQRGTIPAGAGEPDQSLHREQIAGDHPRGCGGTGRVDEPALGRAGPSPRVRGNRGAKRGERPCAGTIPAGAGEPALGFGWGRLFWDHPRGCGGTRHASAGGRRSRGPSPRVRGNPARRCAARTRAGTIPAGAGEPMRSNRRALDIGDHPRGCGGTGLLLFLQPLDPGPSPRVRGNPGNLHGRGKVDGTIPAGAGEPPNGTSRRAHSRDHPRGCGGTLARRKPFIQAQGPSPRVRGNRRAFEDAKIFKGTIPAGAGEPLSRWARPAFPRDHPRGCGGTGREEVLKLDPQGPSPRVRGNPARLFFCRMRGGTIPAGAGEPSA